MATESERPGEYPSSSIHVEHLDHIDLASPRQVAAIARYSEMLLQPGNLEHFSWPLFDLTELDEVTPDDLYDSSGKPNPTVVDIVARGVTDYINRRPEFITMLYVQDDAEERLVGGGIVGSPPETENEVWTMKNVVDQDEQRRGLGTKLVAERVREAFRRYPDLKNVYLGVTYDRHMTDREKIGMQQVIQQMDILNALRGQGTVNRAEIEARVDLLKRIVSIHVLPIDVSGILEAVLPVIEDKSIQGVTPGNMITRRSLLVKAMKSAGLSATPSEWVYLKLGAYHTQLLSEQAHITGTRNLPTGRIVLKREVWDELNEQLAAEGI